MALVLFELPGRCTSVGGRERTGRGALRRALAPTFRAGSDLLIIPWRGWAPRTSGAALLDRREPLIFLFSKFSIAPIDGARAVRATGSHIGAGRERTGRGALRRALAPTFRAGSDLLIIPSRVWAPPHLARRFSTGASR